jgi:hypothetical protein
VSKLNDLITWAKENGDEKVLDRMKVFSLQVLMTEGITLESVDGSTECSDECFSKIKEAAEKVTKQSCPF